MLDQFSAWWRARTGRERALIQIAAALAFAAALPLMLLSNAMTYRARAGADLKAAEALFADVERLAAQPARGADTVTLGADPDAAMLAVAQELGLTIVKIELAGTGRRRVAIGPGDSRAILAWMHRMGRAGLEVRSAQMVRVGETLQVEAEFELGGQG